MTATADEALKTRICLIDSNDKHRSAVKLALSSYYLIKDFANSQDALDWLRQHRPALVVMDEDVAPLSGLSLLEAFFRIPYSRRGDGSVRPPLVCMGSRKASPFLLRARELGADFLLLKPFQPSQIIHALSALVNRKLEEGWERLPEATSDALLLSADLFDSLSDMVENGMALPLSSIANACKSIVQVVDRNQTEILLSSLNGHNNVILVHSVRVAVYLALFGRSTGYSGGSLMALIMAGLLHDLGKIEIPFQVLNKPGAITFDDRKTMRNHVVCTIDMLERTPGMPHSVVVAVTQHHERLDGTGYPQGLSGKEVSAFARQLAIADVFCAMTDIRPYRAAKSKEAALKEMDSMKGAFDPSLFMVFKRLVTEESALIVPSEPVFRSPDQAVPTAP
jgi:HD-GYP domain-containing protein (c-di-GMP phosphodiesterase class II)